MLNYDESRCYAAHLIAEHRRLHRTLRLVRATIVTSCGPDRDATCASIVRVLRQLRDELECHFAQEESGGCLEEVMSCCPSLSAEARRIEAEHPQLLDNVDRLIAQALECDQSAEKQVTLGRGFDDLCWQLDAHEAAENVMLRKSFGANVNGGENAQPTLTHHA